MCGWGWVSGGFGGWAGMAGCGVSSELMVAAMEVAREPSSRAAGAAAGDGACAASQGPYGAGGGVMQGAARAAGYASTRRRGDRLAARKQAEIRSAPFEERARRGGRVRPDARPGRVHCPRRSPLRHAHSNAAVRPLHLPSPPDVASRSGPDRRAGADRLCGRVRRGRA